MNGNEPLMVLLQQAVTESKKKVVDLSNVDITNIPPEYREEVQRSIYIERWVWDVIGIIAKKESKTRPEMIREDLLNRVGCYLSELPQLQEKLADLEKQEDDIKALKMAVLNRIYLCKDQENIKVQAINQKSMDRKQAVIDTGVFLEMARLSNLPNEHYKKLSELSGIPGMKIKTFLKDNKFRPTEAQLNDFYLG